MRFQNKTAIITGAASGMGLYFSKSWVAEGGNVVMSDISAAALEQAAEELNLMRAGCAIGVLCDVRDYEQVCAVRDRAVETYGSIDLLVNFAGGAETRMLGATGMEFPDVPIEVYDWGIDVNLKGQLYFDHAVLKQMREQKSGVIINIGSITGIEGCKYNVSYAASKSAAMNGLTKSIAAYGAKYNIRCNCVSPGPVLTREAMGKMRTALGRAAEVKEIISAVLYLASDDASFITGVDLLIDGGRNTLQRGFDQ